eukprot:TRINITY_DN45234_c0_g1_i1.p1 TRINITY_DN45234_c0_g1~~TRINITY_DN45234_c0_g1_i1.p1  ORF type:complete len:234 (+),score=27.16 TRINITY_DN45234_c0_g1_i1:81-704(+)
MPAMGDFEDPEEAEAWAAMRAAFADDDAAAGVSFNSVDPTNAGDEAMAKTSGDGSNDGKVVAKLQSSKVSFEKKTSSKGTVAEPADADTAPQPATDEVWLQEQVDQLVGEVQRLGGGPFSARMLSQLWSLPLGDQHDVLMGTTGSKGNILETALERAARIWKLIGEELSARCGTKRSSAGAKKTPTAGRDRSRSRSRSGSRSRSPSI